MTNFIFCRPLTAADIRRLYQPAKEQQTMQQDDITTEQAIQAKGLTAPRVTPGDIAALMERVSFSYEVQQTSTFCHGFLDGKFYLATGHSACVSPENFNVEIGRDIAYKAMVAKAYDKLWELEGYALYKRLKEQANG